MTVVAGHPVDPPPSPPDNYLLYDGECPVCSRYVLWTGLRRHCPDIALLNAREWPDLVASLRAGGTEVNDTMVLRLNGEHYEGAAALTKINSLVPPDSFQEHAVHVLSRSPGWLKTAYPHLVRGRKLLLRLLRRPEIT